VCAFDACLDGAPQDSGSRIRAASLPVGGGPRGFAWAQDLREAAQGLPPRLHAELACDWATLARAAPVLAHVQRRFVAVVRPGLGAPSAMQAERLAWWADMGNLHVKLVGTAWSEHRAFVPALPPDRLLWGSGGFDAHRPDAQAFAGAGAVLDRNGIELYGLESWH
jgi:hypothetical protein